MKQPSSCLAIAIWLASLLIANSLSAQNPNVVYHREKVKMNNHKKGQYKESRQIDNGYPYTLFDRGKPNFSLSKEIDSVRSKITKPPFQDIYRDIYDDAVVEETDPGGHGSGLEEHTSPAAMAAKNAAFILLINKDRNGTDLTTAEKTRLLGSTLRMLHRANIEVRTEIWKFDLGLTSYIRRSKELILYCQAYDILKAVNMSIDTDSLKNARNRLHKFARNFYRKTEQVQFAKINNVLFCGSAALGVAAVVLHECGYNRFRYNWFPKEWADAAHVLTDDYMWRSIRPRADRDKVTGYSEGPHYFAYAFENLLPFFRAYKNFVPYDEQRSYRYYGKSVNPRNYLYDPAWDNLFQWFVDILHPNGDIPSYDNSYAGEGTPYFLAITGKAGYVLTTPTDLGGTDLRADFISMQIKPSLPAKSADVCYPSSGDLILRTGYDTKIEKSHYLRLAGKKYYPSNGGKHEHEDVSSFIISAGGFPLALDPGYLGYESRDLVNGYRSHNLITVSDGGPDDRTTGTLNQWIVSPEIKIGQVQTQYVNTYIQRKVNMYTIDGHTFYFLVDSARNLVGASKIYRWNLNGNGNLSEGSCTVLESGSKVRWTHPCNAFPNDSGAWNLQAYIAVKGGGASYQLITDSSIGATPPTATIHGNREGRITNHHNLDPPANDKIDWYWGIHSRMRVTKTAPTTKFVTVLWPYRCWDTPPDMTKTESASEASITITGIGKYQGMIVHSTRGDGGTVNLSNPFGFVIIPPATPPVLTYDAENVMLYRAKKDSIYFQFCLAVTTFRAGSMALGRLLKYDTDTLIKSDSLVTASYSLIGKYKYSAYCINESGGTAKVKFFLPDLDKSFKMIAEKSDGTPLTTVYDTTTKKITVTITDTLTEFIIKLEDPCLVSCFFPPTHITIDTTFDFNTGTTETLGHDLDVIASEGHLKITEGSKMVICPDIAFANNDSITLVGYYDNDLGKYPYRTEYNDESGVPTGSGAYSKNVADRAFSKKSMIIVNNKAGLILDSGSFTHVGVNSTILIRKGGTLLVKDSAFLEIGSSQNLGWGEVIAEDGAYVCIEPGARIRFYPNTEDTSDNNVFYLSMHPTKGTIAGTNSAGASGKFTSPTGIYYNNNCLPLCDIKDINIFNSIYNNRHGWSNISYPKARWTIKDTFCADESVIVKAIPTLNETKFHFQVCQYSLLTQNCIGSTTYIPSTVNTTGVWDSIRITEKNLSSGFSFMAGNHYKIKYIVKNDCDEYDTLSKIIFISGGPTSYFTVSDTACPGYGTVIANGSTSTGGISHVWSINQIVNLDIADDEVEEEEILDEDYEYTGSVSSSFNFPDFKFKGGYSYEIRLMLTNGCGSTEYADTVIVPLTGKIWASKRTVNTSDTVKLIAMTRYATGFTWKLNGSTVSTDTVYMPTVNSTRTYYLITDGRNGCHDTDSVVIKVNTMSFAGLDDTLCKGDSSRLGIATGTIPPGYTYAWYPSTGLSDSTLKQPWAKPDSNTTYTLKVKDAIGNIIETDDVTILVEESTIPDFITIQKDTATYTFCFLNHSFEAYPTNHYSWTFGDGSGSTDSTNPCHIFPVLSKDTFYIVCLTVMNKCGDSTICDTVRIDSVGTYIPDTTAPFLGLAKTYGEFNYWLKCAPNPITSKAIIEYGVKGGTAELVIISSVGYKVKTIKLDPKAKAIELDCSGIPKGIYYLLLEVDNRQVQTLKIGVQ